MPEPPSANAWLSARLPRTRAPKGLPARRSPEGRAVHRASPRAGRPAPTQRLPRPDPRRRADVPREPSARIANASANPPAKNGAAASANSTSKRAPSTVLGMPGIPTQPSIPRVSMKSRAKSASASASELAGSSVCARAARRRRSKRCTASAPAARPNRATEIAKNAKWYQITTEKMRVSTISDAIKEPLSIATPSDAPRVQPDEFGSVGDGSFKERYSEQARPAAEHRPSQTGASGSRRAGRPRRQAAASEFG